MRVFALLTVLLFGANTLIAQEVPRLVGETNNLSCDYLLALMDVFHAELVYSPSSKGVVIVSGSNRDLFKKIAMEVSYTSAVRHRRASRLPAEIINGNEDGEARMQFWIYPQGTPMPKNQLSNLSIPKGTKPFYFLTDADGICTYSTVYEYLNQLLRSNPRLRINVVLAERNNRKFQRQAANIRKQLRASRSQRIRFFHDRNGHMRFPLTFIYCLNA